MGIGVGSILRSLRGVTDMQPVMTALRAAAEDVPAAQFALERYVPARGVSARMSDLIANPDVERAMLDRIDHGVSMGMHNWYDTTPLRVAFTDELGPTEGPAQFAHYMDLVAATSPQSRVPVNVRDASYYYHLRRSGSPIPEQGVRNPEPYGHKAHNLHKSNIAGLDERGGWDVLQNAKPPSFSQNLQGNLIPGTMDTHATRLPAMLSEDPRFLRGAYSWKAKGKTFKENPAAAFKAGDLSIEDALKRPMHWSSQPNDNEWGALEQYYGRLGEQRGLEPARAQAAAWAGGGDLTGLKSPPNATFMDIVNQRIMHTAKQRGENPVEVLRKFIRGEAPLLGIPIGGVLWHSLRGAMPDPDQPQGAA